jgi:hypothetical protein
MNNIQFNKFKIKNLLFTNIINTNINNTFIVYIKYNVKPTGYQYHIHIVILYKIMNTLFNFKPIQALK